MRKQTRELLEQMQARLDAQEQRLDAQEQLLTSQEERILAEQKRMDACEQGLAQLAENVRNHNQMLEGYSDLLTNIRNNNVLLERADSQSEMFGIKIARLEKAMKERPAMKAAAAGTDAAEKAASIPAQAETAAGTSGSGAAGSGGTKAADAAADEDYQAIDYFDFENYFRGSKEAIKENQKQYIPYFEGKKKVLDLGCGRGEFLELLKEHGIDATGVDFYEEYADYCKGNGLKAVYGDAVAYLQQCTSCDGIFAGQLAEHLSTEQLVRLCELAYEKLEDGAYLIVETPNPMSLAIYTHAFYIDPSHQKPVHPMTLKYFLEKAGFHKTEIVFTKNSRIPMSIPELKGEGIQNLNEFNESMKQVSELLFGSQDYAIIARK